MKIDSYQGSRFLIIHLFIFMLSISATAQTHTNLERMHELMGNIFSEVKVPWQAVGVKKLSLNLSGDLRYFESRMLEQEKTIITEGGEDFVVNITKVTVNYRNPFRDGFLGEIMYERYIEMTLEWYAPSTGIKNFSSGISDTISAGKIFELEQNYLPFTIGVKEPPAFFSGYFEAITAAVVTGVAAYLFFSVRSK